MRRQVMSDDVVTAGSERPPLATPWLVAGSVLLLALATAGTLRATDHLHLPHAASSPSPTISVPPLETIPPSADAIGSLAPDPRAIRARPYGPGDGVRVLLMTDTGIVSIATVDDMQTIVLPATFNQTIAGAVETRRGPVWLTRPWQFDEHSPSTLFVPDHDEGIVLDGPQGLVEGARDDEFWTARYDSGAAQRHNLDGRSVGLAAPLPFGAALIRGTAAGLLLSDVNDNGLRVWDPARRRYVRTITTGGFSLATGPRHVVWTTNCPWRCPVHLTDLTTGADRLVPLPSGNGAMTNVSLDPSGTTLAFGWASDDPTSTAVYVAGPRDARPRLVARATVDGSVHVAWASPDRLVLVQSMEDQTVVYGWDRRTGALRLGGAYVAGALDTVIAATL